MCKRLIEEIKKNPKKHIGSIFFLLGLVIVLLAGVLFEVLNLEREWISYAFLVVFLLGFLVGILNITKKETNSFLIATIALILSLNTIGTLITVLATIMVEDILNVNKVVQPYVQTINLLIVFIVAAAIVPALKSVLKIMED